MDNLKDFFLDFRDDTLDFIDDHRKGLIIISFIAILILIGLMIVLILFTPEKIVISNADEESGNIIGTKARTLDFKASATKNGDSVESSFEWEVNGGRLEIDESGIAIWILPTDPGVYTITASNEEATASKNITVIGNELSSLYEDSDYKILLQDTDGDGLTDLYEASISRTSQTEKDTDGDGLNDGDEIIMELNPIEEDSKGDGVKDGQRALEYTYKNNGITLEMKGKGNFTRSSVDKYNTETLSNVNSVLDGVYSIYTEASLTSAKITISYNAEKVGSKKLSESSLAVYLLNDTNNTFSKIKTDVDTSKKTLTFETDTLGKYFVADSSKLTSNLSTELVFLLDNSGSMFSKDEYAKSEENDVEFKRVDVVSDIVDRLQGNYRFGVGKFTYEYKELAKLTTDKATIKNRINTIKTEAENFSGTYIGAALEGGLKQFTQGEEGNRRYVVLLSDGIDTSDGEGYNDKLLEEQIEVAKQKNVKIYTIGLGNTIDAENLQYIANQTNGKYYFAATADDLENTFDLIYAELNYNLYDSNNDKVDDSIIIADSGFSVERDGFSFSNFANTQSEVGYGYGMVLFAKLFYENNLPKDLGAKRVTLNSGSVVEAPSAQPDSVKVEGNALRPFVPVTLEKLSNLPSDFWASSTQKGSLLIKSKYKQELQGLGFTTYDVAYDNGDSGFKQYESVKFEMKHVLDEEPTIELEDDDIELFKTLSRLDITKYRDEKFNFYDNNDNAFEKLTSTLSSGEPVMIRINDDYTVLATKMLVDSTNTNKYKIEVYDPNYAGIKKYIEVERYKFSDIAEISKVITDKFEYEFKYQGTNVGICLSFPNVEEND